MRLGEPLPWVRKRPSAGDHVLLHKQGSAQRVVIPSVTNFPIQVYKPLERDLKMEFLNSPSAV